MNTKMPEAMQTDPQIFNEINCKHLGLIVLSDIDSGRKFIV